MILAIFPSSNKLEMDENGEGLKFVKTRQLTKKEHGQERARGVKFLIFSF